MKISCQPNDCYAIIVGVEAYGEGIPTLHGPASDALRFTLWLRKRGLPSTNVKLFLSLAEDATTTQESSRSALLAQVRDAGVDFVKPDQKTIDAILRDPATSFPPSISSGSRALIVYWSGHGLVTDDERTRIVIPSDATTEQPLALDFTGYLFRLRTAPQLNFLSQQWVILDACAQWVSETSFEPATLKVEPTREKLHSTKQHIVCAVSPGNVANNDPTLQAGHFSAALMDVLGDPPNEHAASVWPDLRDLTEKVQKRLVEAGGHVPWHEFDPDHGNTSIDLHRPSIPQISTAPLHLHYLCDRDSQVDHLLTFLETQSRHPLRFRRPIVCIVPSTPCEAPDAFLTRLETRDFPRHFKRMNAPGTVEFVYGTERPQSLETKAFSTEFRRILCDRMDIAPCTDNTELHTFIAKRGVRLVAPVVTFVGEEVFAPKSQPYFEMLAAFWADLPDLPDNVILITFVNVKFLPHNPLSPRRFISLRSFFRKRSIDSINRQLHNAIALFGASQCRDSYVTRQVLPALTQVSRGDVERWLWLPEVRHRLLRHPSQSLLDDIFESKQTLPMDDVIAQLQSLVSK